jgi:hypothetical protein
MVAQLNYHQVQRIGVIAMLGPAELREMDEVLAEERTDGTRLERRTPYITPHFAVGLAMTRAVAGELKQHLAVTHPHHHKR